METSFAMTLERLLASTIRGTLSIGAAEDTDLCHACFEFIIVIILCLGRSTCFEPHSLRHLTCPGEMYWVGEVVYIRWPLMALTA